MAPGTLNLSGKRQKVIGKRQEARGCLAIGKRQEGLENRYDEKEKIWETREQKQLMDAIEFFQQSAGTWKSQRTTHHLAFRQAEVGGSDIQVTHLGADDPKVIEICQMHEVDPSLAAGGAYVTWDGSMAWDKNDENHKGSTVFAIIPDPDNPKKGKMLRERGYAEIVPVAGEFEMDEEDGLVLITEYETMSTLERFWFVGPNIRMRSSAVQRFGGFNTSTFCTEIRVGAEAISTTEKIVTANSFCSVLGW